MIAIDPVCNMTPQQVPSRDSLLELSSFDNRTIWAIGDGPDGSDLLVNHVGP